MSPFWPVSNADFTKGLVRSEISTQCVPVSSLWLNFCTNTYASFAVPTAPLGSKRAGDAKAADSWLSHRRRNALR